METLWQDLRYGIRMLRKSPVFTAVALMTLALGIGANSAIFSVINAVLIKPLPYKDPARLVAVESINPRAGGSGFGGISPADFWDWKEQNRTFEQLAAYVGGVLGLADVEPPEVVPCARVSVNFFQVFGVEPMLGRAFLPEEGWSGGPRAIVISQRLWQRRFGGDPTIVGKTIKTVDGAATVIGVTPPDFKMPAYAEAWTPLARDSGEMKYRASRYFLAVGRVKPGQSLAAAQAEMKTIAGRLADAHPKENRNWTVRLTPLGEYQVRDAKLALLILTGAVGFVLLVACANVANLLLARAASRSQEMAIRLALGASGRRLLRQLLTESVLLALAGGALGLLFAAWGVDALVGLLPPFKAAYQLPSDVRIDGTTLLFTLLVSLLTGILFGLFPGWQASGSAVNEPLKEGNRSTGSRRHQRTRNALIIAETALALVLLIGAGLLMKSFIRLQRVDLGYDPHGLLTMPLSLPWENKTLFTRQILEQVSQTPGVQSVALMSFPTFGGLNFPFNIEGRPLPTGDVTVRYSAISPSYFRTLRAQMRTGREFNDRDTPNAPGVAVINETMARQYFAGEDPIGKKLTIAYLNQRLAREIVGVVVDIKQDEPNSPTKPEIFVSFEQLPWLGATLVIRSASGDPMSVRNAVQRAVRAVDKNQPVKTEAVEQTLANQVAEPRLYTLLLGVFAVLATLLAAVGIYGVMSYAVTQRTREIAIRIAFGAEPSDVLKLVVGQGMRLALIGVGLGWLAGLALTRVLRSMLFGVSPTDPVTFVGVATLLAAVALLASYIPARRAMKVDPMVALRYE